MSTQRNAHGSGLFGYGHMGLPGEIDIELAPEGASDALAHEILARWNEWAENRGMRTGRRAAERQFAEIATLAAVLVRHHVRQKRPPNELAAFALEHALGLINPKSGQPVPNADVARRYGIPIVDDMANFLEAAQLDGEADAVGVPLSQGTLARTLGKAPSTIRRWREMPQYVQRRAYVRALGHPGVRQADTSSHS